MTPLSRVQMGIKLTNASSRVITDLHIGGGYTNTLARIESVCTFKLGDNCLNLLYRASLYRGSIPYILL